MRQTATGTDYAVASESVAIDALDSQFKLARDVAAGEAIFISLKVSRQCDEWRVVVESRGVV